MFVKYDIWIYKLQYKSFEYSYMILLIYEFKVV